MASFTLVTIEVGDLVSQDLISALEDLGPEETVEPYRANMYGVAQETRETGSPEVLNFPERGRVGIAWQGETVWVDSSSAEEAMERYLERNVSDDGSGV